MDRDCVSRSVFQHDQLSRLSFRRVVHCSRQLSHLRGRISSPNSLWRSGGNSGKRWWCICEYAMIAYALIGVATGHHYPEIPMFGVTPCPVTIFTLGMFLLTTGPVPKGLLVVPFFWFLIGGSAAILLHVPQDWVLLASGFIAIPVMVFRDRQTKSNSRLPKPWAIDSRLQ